MPLRSNPPFTLSTFFAVALLAGAQAAPAQATSGGPPAHLVVPWHGTSVVANVHEGHVIVDGDISIGTVAEVQRRLATRPDANASDTGPVGTDGYTAAYLSNRWPSTTPGSPATVPYVISTPGYPANGQAIGQAIATFNATFAGVIQLVGRTNEADYVDFNLTGVNASGTCFAEGIGRTGGAQTIGGSVTCNQTTLLHEIGHMVGLYHEHQRPDAIAFLTYTPLNLDKPYALGGFGSFDSLGEFGNFDAPGLNANPIGLYDLGSLMQYGRHQMSAATQTGEFSKNGQDVLETIPAGIPIGEASTYSAGDIDTIERLYDAAPTLVTVTTFPAGLPIVVDSVSFTSPHTFAWELDSQHTISVSSAYLQRGNDLHSKYLFGNWNDGQARTHTVTVTRGNRERTQPEDRPAVTVYQASFQHYVDLELIPPSGGIYTVTPTPVEIVGSPYNPWVLNQSTITLSANPIAGNQFYRWTGQQALREGSNPWSFRITLGFFQISAEFVAQQPMYTIDSLVLGSSPPISPSHPPLDGFVDGQDIYYAKNYIAPDWAPGQTSHQVEAFNTLFPITGNVEYHFASWSDGGAIAHDLAALPADGATYTVRYLAHYHGFSENDPACATNTAPVPDLLEGYPDGSEVPFSVTPLSGWSFAGWTDALTGQPNPTTLTVHDQFVVVARFNTIAEPLTITSFTPSSIAQGEPVGPLQIHGSGFTASSQVFVNGVTRAASFVDSTRLDIVLQPSDVTNVGALDIQVFNSTVSPACSVQRDAALPVLKRSEKIFKSNFEYGPMRSGP